MPTIDEIHRQIKNIPDSKNYFSKSEIKVLPELLHDDEIVEHMMNGIYDGGIGVIFATNKRLLFVDKGFIKLRVEDFPYEKISSIRHKLGLFKGEIEVYTSNNKAQITNCPKKIVQGFADQVRKRMAKEAQPKPTMQQASPAANTVIDQLERLAKLKEQGILTDDEFLREKERILTS